MSIEDKQANALKNNMARTHSKHCMMPCVDKKYCVRKCFNGNAKFRY